MTRQGSSTSEREYATLVAELRAMEEDVAASRAIAREAATPHLDFHHHVPAAPHGERIAVAGGATIVIRAVEPADRAQLAAGFQHLSAMTRLRTLREPARGLTPRQLDALTDVDHVEREVLVAFDAATGEGIGLGRYARDPDRPERAELACTVADAWQRRGVATALIVRIAAGARAAGIEQFVAHTVVGDEPGRRLLARVADRIVERRDGGVVELSARPRQS